MSYLTRANLGLYPIDSYDAARKEATRAGFYDPQFVSGNLPSAPGKTWVEQAKNVLLAQISEMRRNIEALKRGDLSPDVLPAWEVPGAIWNWLQAKWSYLQRASDGHVTTAERDLYQLVELHEKEREVNLPAAIDYYVQTHIQTPGQEHLAPPGEPPATEEQVVVETQPYGGDLPNDSTLIGENTADPNDYATSMKMSPTEFAVSVKQEFDRLYVEDPALLAERLPELLETARSGVHDEAIAKQLIVYMLSVAGASPEMGLPEDLAPPAPPPEKPASKWVWIGAIAGGISAIAGLILVSRRRKK